MFTVALAVASCTPNATSPTDVPSARATATTTPTGGLPRAIAAEVRPLQRWNVLPDVATIVADFAVDPRPGDPVVRVDGGSDAAMTFTAGGPRGFGTIAGIDISSLAPGEHRAEVFVRLSDGSRAPVGSTAFLVSAPEYVVWTLDFEGDSATDEAMANTAAIADRHGIPMTIMWNPRVWTTTQVAPARADAMVAWTKARMSRGDELALHVHMWTDFIRAAGLAPRTSPSWAGRGDGYDVPMTAYDGVEQRAILEYALRLMADHGLERPTTFRAGGQFANAATLRALAALGFAADCSAVAAGTFGRLTYPWTLGSDAQPYHPSANDASAAGSLPLLEAPTIGGNTYGYNMRTITPIIRADLSLLAAAGGVAKERRAITIVSHPATIDSTERAAIESLFDAFGPLRYDADRGPVRFVTLAQLARDWR